MAAAAASADATAAPASEGPAATSSAEPLPSVPTADADLVDESDEDSDDDHKQVSRRLAPASPTQTGAGSSIERTVLAFHVTGMGANLPLP